MVMQTHPTEAPVQTCERFALAATGCGSPSRLRCARMWTAQRRLPTTRQAARTAGKARDAWSNTTGNTAALVTGDAHCPTFAPQRQTAMRSGRDQPLRLADALRNRLTAKPPTSKAPPTNRPHSSQRFQSRGAAAGCNAASPASGCACAARRACAGCHRAPRSRRSACSIAPSGASVRCARALPATSAYGGWPWARNINRSGWYPTRSVGTAVLRPWAATNRHWRSRTGAVSSCGGDAAAVPWPSRYANQGPARCSHGASSLSRLATIHSTASA